MFKVDQLSLSSVAIIVPIAIAANAPLKPVAATTASEPRTQIKDSGVGETALVEKVHQIE